MRLYICIYAFTWLLSDHGENTQLWTEVVIFTALCLFVSVDFFFLLTSFLKGVFKPEISTSTAFTQKAPQFHSHLYSKGFQHSFLLIYHSLPDS